MSNNLINREYLRNVDALLSEATTKGTVLYDICQESKFFRKLADIPETGMLEQYIVDLEDEVTTLSDLTTAMSADISILMTTCQAIIGSLQYHDSIFYDILEKVKCTLYPTGGTISIPHQSNGSLVYHNPKQRTLF